ncbi:MAG TPA: MFS transporter, partial [Acidimicrobiales bacterium]
MPEGSSGSPVSAVERAPRPPFPLILSITLTGILGNVLVTPAAPDIAEEFGTGASGVGLVLGAATAPGVLLAPIIGVLADRYGRRTVVVPCLAIFGIAGGLAVFAQTFPVLLALRFLQGCGAAGLINLAVVIIGDHWDGPDRAKMIGRNAAALTASIAVLPPLGGLLADIGGWRLTFAPYWIGVVTAVAAFKVLPRGTRGEGTLREQLRRTAPYLRNSTVLGATGMTFVVFVLIFGLFLAVLPVHLAGEFGIGATGRGLVLAVPAFSSTATALMLGRLRGRFGANRLLVFGSMCLAGGVGTLAVAPNVPILLLGPVIYGFGEGILIPTLQDIVAGVPPASSRGSVVAFFVGVTRLGQTVGPVALGAAVERTSAASLFAAGAA